MNRKHFVSGEPNKTLCGYICTAQEYKRMFKNNKAFVNCKRCLERLK
jgi:hypothetical protein